MLQFSRIVFRSFLGMVESTAPGCVQDRDVKEEPSPKRRKLDGLPMPKCGDHSSVDCTFWCDDCNIAICMQCADEQHEKHSLNILRHVIKDKVVECLRVLSMLKNHSNNVSECKLQCNQEIAFCAKSIRRAQLGRTKCEKVERFLKSFDSQLPSFERAARHASDSDIRINVDVKLLGELLALYGIRDSDYLELPSRMILKVGHIRTDDPSSFSLSGCQTTFQGFCRREFMFDLMESYVVRPFIFRFKCISSVSWPVKASIRIVTTEYDDESQTYQNSERRGFDARVDDLVTSCQIANDLVFADASTEHTITTRSYSRKISYAVEIYPIFAP